MSESASPDHYSYSTPDRVLQSIQNGINIWLVKNESKDVRRIKLQLLEGEDAGLFNSQRSNRPHRN